jgi:hypothetical protein
MEQMTSLVVKQMVSPIINYKGSMERKISFGHPSLRYMSTFSLNDQDRDEVHDKDPTSPKIAVLEGGRNVVSDMEEPQRSEDPHQDKTRLSCEIIHKSMMLRIELS